MSIGASGSRGDCGTRGGGGPYASGAGMGCGGKISIGSSGSRGDCGIRGGGGTNSSTTGGGAGTGVGEGAGGNEGGAGTGWPITSGCAGVSIPGTITGGGGGAGEGSRGGACRANGTGATGGGGETGGGGAGGAAGAGSAEGAGGEDTGGATGTGGAGGESLDPDAAPKFPAAAGRLGALTADDPDGGAAIDTGTTGSGRDDDTGAEIPAGEVGDGEADGIPPNPSNAAAIGFDAPMLGLAAPGIDPIGRLGVAPAPPDCISVCTSALSGEKPPICDAAALRDSPTSGEIDRAPRTRGIRIDST